ncbi:hypothetical protein BJ742DRAFT_775065 [Cladochytrium replicatum]|nr:hypothetical protein BJ742DRAFT_775065 [Cladochytrium replicatum]
MRQQISPSVIVAFAGKRFAGKDTIADALAASLRFKSWHIERTAIASAIKRRFIESLDDPAVTLQSLESDRSIKESIRPKLIALAEFERERDPEVWIRSAWTDAVRSLSEVDRNAHSAVVISDLRLVEEIDFLRSQLSGRVFVVYVRASEDARRARGWKPDLAVDSHRSENALDSSHPLVGLTVENDDRDSLDIAIDTISSVMQSMAGNTCNS